MRRTGSPATQGFGSLAHLARRFFGALDPRGPDPAGEAWATGWLLPGEIDLWSRMSGPDRRHAVGVAHDTAALLGRPLASVEREVMAAALLHDVGKVESGLGTFARVAVTLAALALGRDRLTRPSGDGGARSGATAGRRRRWRDRVRDYLVHDRIGADLLERAGSSAFTVAWAAEHHLAEERWSVDAQLGGALKAADGD